MTDASSDLLGFIDAGPSVFHAVAEITRRLDDAGFSSISELDADWSVPSGEGAYVVRDGGSIVAWRAGAKPPAEAGFRLVGAHTDSPTFKVRPIPDVRRHGWTQLGCETYGAPLTYTWLDRDLTLAGRVAVLDGGAVSTRLVHLPGAPLRIPSLAIHLNREIREKGLLLNDQHHLVPVWGLGDGSHRGLVQALAHHLDVDADSIVGHDLVLADTQPSTHGGDDEAFVVAPRLDNLLSCHAGLSALLSAEPGDATQVLVANDHEEVGSSSAEGAAGSFLADVLERIVATAADGPADRGRALARSALVSCDAAHAVHPNYADRHEAEHRPRMNGGPVIKHNANQAYASDAASVGEFVASCRDAGVPVQHFVTRGDLPCGSTIGPLTATRLGLAAVDVGSAILSMHSVRETGGTHDVDLMIRALTAHLER